jgi:hypothetical protein
MGENNRILISLHITFLLQEKLYSRLINWNNNILGLYHSKEFKSSPYTSLKDI